MAASSTNIISSFIQDAPPGELADVVTDIKALTHDSPHLLSSQSHAFKSYHESQFTTVKLSGSSQEVVISPHNSTSDGRYYDVASQTSFDFDHTTQKASNAKSHVLESRHADLVRATLKAYQKQTAEHFPAASLTVCPAHNDSEIAIILVANKYSPNNFWNGRWRSSYTYDPQNGSINGSIKVDIHYYEDGNVRLLTEKSVAASVSAAAGAGAGSAESAQIVRSIAIAEKKYQEDLNRAFTSLSEGAFKSLRRQLPVTRQKVEWDKISGYRLGQDIGGGRSTAR